MKKLNKKAMENLNKIIIALVVFVILIALAIGIVRFAMRQGDQDICLISVVAADKSDKILGIDCNMYQAGKLKLQGTTKDAEKKDAMKQIAELMRDCWHQFGEGKMDPFKGAWVDLTTVCFVCSKFSFETEDGISEREFVDFLKNNELTNTSYHSYLKGSLPETDRDAFFIESINFQSILGITTEFSIGQHLDYFRGGAILSQNRDYGVVIYAVATKKVRSFVRTFFKWPPESLYDIYVVPYENIEKLSCDRLQG
ncbi:hypothetical protein HYU07_00155 [Candidatus Woesearchaeota archaeon]|nr:hypothetical protein [Candidatus Woesearchaeota archaeon]